MAAIAADPSTPSSQKPVFAKPDKDDKKRGKGPGREKGRRRTGCGALQVKQRRYLRLNGPEPGRWY